MELRHCAVGPWFTNAYALVCQGTGKSVLIDPGADPYALQILLEDTEPAAILVTHSHFDHIGALSEMRRLLKVPVMGYAGENNAVAADVRLQGGERLPLGDGYVTVTHAPGHTADQLCYGLEEDSRMIVGDTIFDGGPGKTWTPEEFQTTLVTLRKVVLTWPSETVCFPGHGASFRLAEIRTQVEAFVGRDHGVFFGDAVWNEVES